MNHLPQQILSITLAGMTDLSGNAQTSASQMFSISTLSVYSIMCHVMISSLHVIGKEMDQFGKEDEKNWRANVDLKLMKWKRCYAFVCECVNQFNDCFGAAMLIQISFYIVSIISSAFQISMGLQAGWYFDDICSTLLLLLHHGHDFWTICSAGGSIAKQVAN